MSKKLVITVIILIIIIGAVYSIYQSLTPVPKEEPISGEVYSNSVYGYSVSIPESWKGKYFAEEKENITSFVYNSLSELKHNLFSIIVYSNNEWQQTKSEPGFHGTEIITKNDLVFVYVISLDNPYTGEEGDEYQKMAGGINNIISTFKFQDGAIQAETKIGYVKKLYDEGGKKYMDFDEIKWLSATDGTCTTDEPWRSDIPACNPNGFLILNENEDVNTYEVGATVVKKTSEFAYSETGERIIGYESFINLGEEHFNITPYIIKIRNGIISEITEKYIP